MSFQITRNLVDLIAREIFPATVSIEDNKIVTIERVDNAEGFIMPGFVDSHIHVESSMLLPVEFARIAVTHGTVATVSDPHEIANVCGVHGVNLMLENAAQVNFKFMFGAPSCVPATVFETAGACLDAAAVEEMLNDSRIGYLSEVMNFPGVLAGDAEMMAKIASAKKANKPIDGHAPGLRAEQAAKYVAAGITTDHECVCADEARDKIAAGCKIAIREGSAARNFDALWKLIDEFPDFCMFCSDDKHPDEFLQGHINLLAARAIANGCDIFNVLNVACRNPVDHYKLPVGMLQVGDPADFILVDNLEQFAVEETYINGELVAENGSCLLPSVTPTLINQFDTQPIEAEGLLVKAGSETMRVIEAIDGELITNSIERACVIENGFAVTDVKTDLLKLVVYNRYQSAPPAVAFITGFGLSDGALASTVAHDSHNIVAVGTNDKDLASAINLLIQHQGGLSVCNDGDHDVLPLPVAGLMSTGTCEEVGQAYGKLDAKVKQLGCQLRAPYMTLSFMPLLVIPSLKLSDKGLFDVDSFQFVPLFL